MLEIKLGGEWTLTAKIASETTAKTAGKPQRSSVLRFICYDGKTRIEVDAAEAQVLLAMAGRESKG